MFKKLLLILLIIVLGITLGYAKSFEDEETLIIQGNRPKVNIELSELLIEIEPQDFEDSQAVKEITIYNEGNVSCYIDTSVQNVPYDLNVTVYIDDDILEVNGETTLTITVNLTEQQENTYFSFIVIIRAEMQ
jgi:hypothetical protein